MSGARVPSVDDIVTDALFSGYGYRLVPGLFGYSDVLRDQPRCGSRTSRAALDDGYSDEQAEDEAQS